MSSHILQKKGYYAKMGKKKRHNILYKKADNKEMLKSPRDPSTFRSKTANIEKQEGTGL